MPLADILFQDNFERGSDGLADAGRFDSETDTANQLDIPHYTTLARTTGLPMPYSGAYCLRAALTGGNADAFVTEVDINQANGETWWFKWNMWINPTFATDSTADDIFTVFETQGAGNVVTFAVGFRYTDSSGLLEMGAGELTPTSFSGQPAPLGEWFTVEVGARTDTDSTDGTIDVYITVDGQQPSSTANVSVASIQNIAGTHGVLGIQDHETTTLGTLLFDNFMMDTLRMFPTKDRFATTVRMTQSGHVFLGPGRVEKIVMIGGTAADNVVELFDSDTSEIYISNKKTQIVNLTAADVLEGLGTPFEVIRGLYYHDSDGTNVPGTLASPTSPAETMITISRAPNWFSDGNIRRLGLKRSLVS